MEMPVFLAPITTAPRPQKVILGVFGLAILGAAAWFLLLSPLTAQIATLTAEDDRVKKELVQARAIAADVARYRKEIATLERTLVALTERLPNERETPPLYRSVTDAAYQSGLAVSLFQPKEAQIRDYYAEIPIAFTAEGNYHQLGSFFERVARLSRVVNVEDLKISGLAGKDARDGKSAAAAPPPTGPARADLVLATYMYRPVGAPPAPKPGTPGAAAAKPAGAK